RATIAGGVFAGAKKAVQSHTSTSAPLSFSVGTSGHQWCRSLAVMAIARAVPARSGPEAGGGSQMVMVTWPATTALTDSPLLLYGMWTNPVPVFCLNSSVAIWNAAALEP